MIAQLFAVGVSTFVCGQFAVSERLRLALVLVAPLRDCSLFTSWLLLCVSFSSKLGKAVRSSESIVVQWLGSGKCAVLCIFLRFINEIVAILTDNDVTDVGHLRTLKFEFLAWPAVVSGASWLSLHSVCQSMHLFAQA